MNLFNMEILADLRKPILVFTAQQCGATHPWQVVATVKSPHLVKDFTYQSHLQINIIRTDWSII